MFDRGGKVKNFIRQYSELTMKKLEQLASVKTKSLQLETVVINVTVVIGVTGVRTGCSKARPESGDDPILFRRNDPNDNFFIDTLNRN